MALDRSFFVNLKGRDFVLYGGLLDAATKSGLRSVRTAIAQLPTADNAYLAVVTAEVTFEDGRVFTAIGDASPASVGAMIVPHLLRMAETRAIGRAFRTALNIAATMKEELGGDDEPEGHMAAHPGAAAHQPARAVGNGQKAAPAGRGAVPGGSDGRAAVVSDRVQPAPAVSDDVSTAKAPPPDERLCPLCQAEGRKRYLTESQYLTQANLGRVPVCKQHEEERIASA